MAFAKSLPKFEDLPLNKGDPPYSAWGLWKNEKLGALNWLTDDLVAKTAKEEIKTGIRVGMNLPLDFLQPPLFGRKKFEREVINKAPRIVNDDVIHINTQSSSQWDGFRHYAYQEEKQFYNGTTQDDIHGKFESTCNGIDEWQDKGIAGRGVLIDVYSWIVKNNVDYDPLARTPITFETIEKVAKDSNIEFRHGDILITRTGFTQAYAKMSAEQKEAYADPNKRNFPGFAQSKEAIKWLWDHQFSAVAGDQPGFECIPPVDEKLGMLHPIILSGWGMTIGELFNLEELSEACKKLGRWTFFVTSSPLLYTGAVASPPNIMAIF